MMSEQSERIGDRWFQPNDAAAVHPAGTRSSISAARRTLWRFLDGAYALDLRSLSLFRICLGALILGDLVWRAMDLRAFYTDFGVLPRAVLLDRTSHWIFSLHLMSGAAPVQAVLFLLAMGFGVMLLIGYRTKLATIASWILLVSLHNRNPIILQGGDDLLRLLVFWAMFLPLNAHFSIDRALNDTNAGCPQRVFTAGSIALMLQVVLMYWFAVLWKSAPEWRTEGSAVYYALSLEQFATPVGRFLLRFPSVLTFLTFLTMAIEAWAPLFLLCPVMTGPVRTAAICMMLVLQVGLLVCMHLGHFPLVAIVAVIGFIPSGFWQVARWVLDHSAVRAIADRAFDLVARHRSLLARIVHPPTHRPLELRTHWATNFLAAFFLGYVVWWNLGTMNSGLSIPGRYRWIGTATGTDQAWDMFAPHPLRDDGWYVIPGVLRNGRQVDVFRNGASVSFAKPSSSEIAAQYRDERWRKYLINLYTRNNDHRLYYARYLCRKWNEGRVEGDPKSLETIEIYFMMRSIRPRTQLPMAHQKHLLIRHPCT